MANLPGMLPKRRVLITGATSGLGREMALQLARTGARIAATGRREELLRALDKDVEAAGGECLVLPGSVCDLEAVRRDYASIRARWGGLDWAILNAGIGGNSDAKDFRAAAFHETFAINVGGVVNWLEAVLPDMIAARGGTVAAIASLAGARGLPGSGAYSASKAAVITLMESARIDLRGTGVRAVTVCPGFVKSEITARNDPGKMAFLLETEDGARRILDGVERGSRVVHFPWQLSLPVLYGLAWLPGWLYEWGASRVGPRRKQS